MGGKPKWWRRFWIEAATITVALLVLDLALYLSSIIDLRGLAQGILSIFYAIFVTYAVRHIILNVLSDKTVLRVMKIGYTVGGGCLGTLLGGILGVFIVRAFNIPEPTTTFELWFRFFLFFGVAPIVGTLVGFRVGKRRGFRPLHRGYIEDV